MTTLDSRQSCGNCRFWQKRVEDDGTVVGDCHRLPPQYEGWPRTLPGEWCGEYLQRIAKL